MDLRNIKAARKHLVAIGWLQMRDTRTPSATAGGCMR